MFYDTDGNQCRQADAFYAVTTTEPEWDDESQALAVALFEHEASLCPCGCGNPLEVAEDPEQPFEVHSFTCRARKAIKQIERAEEAKNKSAPDGWDDGRTHFAVPVDDDRAPDKKRGRRRAH